MTAEIEFRDKDSGESVTAVTFPVEIPEDTEEGKGMSKANRDSISEPERRDPDHAGAEAAMKRAAEKARERARQVGSGIVVWKDGRVVIEPLSKQSGE